MLRRRATVSSVLATGLAGVLAAVAVGVGGVAPASGASCPKPGGAGVPAPKLPRADVVFAGGGWGHGMGMSQYGAQGAARLGCSYPAILGTYYRATELATWKMTGPVRLQLLTGAARATVQAETGAVRWAGGAVQPKGETWTVVRRGAGVSVRDAQRERAWVKDGTALTGSHSGAVIRVRSFRAGATSASSDLRTRFDQARFTGAGGRITVVQQLVSSGGHTAAQKYLWGLAEVPSSWPAEALKAQAVAARTYLTAKARNGGYDLLTTTSDQVYRGWSKESTDTGGAWRKAVEATEGKVIVDRTSGKTITAMYSSSMGGWTEDRQYVYGAFGISYLRAVDDSRWDRASDNPFRSWAVGFSKPQLAKKLGFTSVSGVRIAARGNAARVGGVVVTGVRGGKNTVSRFTGAQIRYRLGLRSPGFVVLTGTTGSGAAAPVVPVVKPAAAQPISGDWDGDGTSDPGWYDNGVVTLRVNGERKSYRFGTTGDRVVSGDWDGDGRDGIAVFRAGRWFLREAQSTGAAEKELSLGRAGDVPVAGSWKGGKADGIGVVRGGAWYLRFTASSGVAERAFPFGASAAGTPLTGDWNGDGTDDPGARTYNVFRLAALPAGAAAIGWVDAPREVASPAFGGGSNAALTGDWDGEGGDTPAVVQGPAFVFRNDLKGGAGTGSVTFAP